MRPTTARREVGSDPCFRPLKRKVVTYTSVTEPAPAPLQVGNEKAGWAAVDAGEGVVADLPATQARHG